MIQSGAFWILVAASVLIFWLLPHRMRAAFLALTSATYLLVIAPWSAGPFLAWSVGFYFAAPLAARPRIASARDQSPQLTGDDLEEQGGGATAGGTLTLVSAPPTAAARYSAHRWMLPALIISILIYLLAFKYLPEILSTLLGKNQPAALVPLGISYFTFKLIHYAVELARRNIPDHSFWQYLCYLFLFPTITAGPIERFDHFLLNQQSHFSSQMLVNGLHRIALGLIKKFVLADMLLLPFYQRASSPVLLGPMHAVRTYPLWGLGMATYLFVYLDFAGYSDIAIGVSSLFGVRIMENFDWPILAPNIGAFWKRWHMTLAGWCQSYIYMPVLGKTRKPYLALYATFAAIGLWHAAGVNWLVWGLYHATGITIFQVWTRAKRRNGWTGVDRTPLKYLAIPLTFLFVAVGEIITVAGRQNGYLCLYALAKLFFIKIPRPW